MKKLILALVLILVFAGRVQAQKFPVQVKCDGLGLGKKVCKIAKKAVKSSPDWRSVKKGERYGIYILALESVPGMQVAISASYVVWLDAPLASQFPHFIGHGAYFAGKDRLNSELGDEFISDLNLMRLLFEAVTGDLNTYGFTSREPMMLLHPDLGAASTPNPQERE